MVTRVAVLLAIALSGCIASDAPDDEGALTAGAVLPAIDVPKPAWVFEDVVEFEAELDGEYRFAFESDFIEQYWVGTVINETHRQGKIWAEPDIAIAYQAAGIPVEGTVDELNYSTGTGSYATVLAGDHAMIVSGVDGWQPFDAGNVTYIVGDVHLRLAWSTGHASSAIALTWTGAPQVETVVAGGFYHDFTYTVSVL